MSANELKEGGWLNGWCTGENNGNARLTDAVVKEIRRRLATGARQKDLAQEFGVSQSHMSKLARGICRADRTPPR